MSPQKSDIVTLIQDRLGQTADHILIYNNYDLTEGSVLLFTFKHGAASPFSVLKLSRNRSILLREYKNLQLICDACPGLATTPLFFDELGEYGVLCTEPLNANRLTGYRAQSRKLKLVTSRLSRLHELLRTQTASTSFASDEYLRPFLALYDTEIPISVADFYNQTAAQHVQLLRNTAPSTIPQHGDLYFDNILISGRQVFFLDWEDFGEIQLPGYDLFSLVFDICRLQDDSAEVVNKSIEFVASSTWDYFRRLKIPAELVGTLMAYTLVQQYLRSWTQGRTSKQVFGRRLLFLAENKHLLDRLANAYGRHWQ